MLDHPRVTLQSHLYPLVEPEHECSTMTLSAGSHDLTYLVEGWWWWANGFDTNLIARSVELAQRICSVIWNPI